MLFFLVPQYSIFDKNGKKIKISNCISIIPPRNVHHREYKCDSKFYTHQIEQLFQEVETNGIVLVFGDETKFYKISGQDIYSISKITSFIKNNHNNGGQSQNRYQRIRDIQINDYVTSIVKEFKKIEDCEEIILAGCGNKKSLVFDKLSQKLKSKITQYAVEKTVKIETIVELFKNENKELKENIYKFYEEIRNDMVVYGKKDTKEYLSNGFMDVVFVYEEDASKYKEYKELSDSMGTEIFNLSSYSNDLLVSKFIYEFGGFGGITRWKINID